MPPRPRPIRAWCLPNAVAPASGQAAALAAQLDQQLVQQLGALPLLMPILGRLRVRALVNERCHGQDTTLSALDWGQVVEVIVLNRLLAPRPLVHVEDWVASTVLPDLLGLEASQCNDDRLARALDALVPQLEPLWQDLIVTAAQAFDLDLSLLAYDITSVSFCGDYDEAELVSFGYSRDHRPDRKQVELATTVTVAGGVPLDYRLLAGNVADRTTPVENLERLRQLLLLLPSRRPEEPTPLVISDRAMLTLESIVAYEAGNLHFLGPLEPALGRGAVRALLESLPQAELETAPLAYRPQRAEDDASWQPYHGVRRPLVIAHPQPSRPPLQLQALVVWSPAKARLDGQLRARQLQQLEQALADLAGKLGRRPYTRRETVQKRLATLLRRHPGRPFLQVQVQDGADGQPLGLSWTRQEQAIARAAALDGRYVLGTNAPLSGEQMLALSKRRDVPEKRYALIKGPLAVRPIYLHKQERIRALVFCTMVALLIFALLRAAGSAGSLEPIGQQAPGTVRLAEPHGPGLPGW